MGALCFFSSVIIETAALLDALHLCVWSNPRLSRLIPNKMSLAMASPVHDQSPRPRPPVRRAWNFVCSGRRAASPRTLRPARSCKRSVAGNELCVAKVAAEQEPNRVTASEADVRIEMISADRGFGVRATRAFMTGELILTEEPLLSVQREFFFSISMDEDMVQQRTKSLLNESLCESLRRLSSSEHASFDALACYQPDGRRSALGIFRTNALETGSRGSVFALSARFNHSCVPNVSHRWSNATGRLVMKAARDIRMGEELTIAYRAQDLPREERRRQLRTEFGFMCECDLCSAQEV